MHRGTVLASTLGLSLFLCTSGARAAQPDRQVLVGELNRYSGYIGRALQPKEVALLDDTRSRAGVEVQALAAALLFRADPIKYRAEFSSHFTIRDHAARARGEAVEISQEAFVSKLKELEQSYPSLHPTLMLLVSFTRFRDANLWFPQGGQKVSVARFLRGAFLAAVFKGSDEDAVAVANRLDQEARQQYENGVSRK